MRTLIGFCLAVILATSLSAQNRGGFTNPQPTIRGSFGDILFPGGTRATVPGTQRTFGTIPLATGSGPRLNIPGAVTDPTFLRPGAAGSGYGRSGYGQAGFGQSGFGRSGFGRDSRRATIIAVPYAVPVYGGGFYDNPYLPAPEGGAPQQQPNITVIYPPQQPLTIYPSAGGDQTASDAFQVYQAPVTQPAAEAAASNESPQPQYLIAFKDHTIYSAIAYWVDGETLHYFTSGNTHNQVSLSLIDKALTERLNRESGIDLRLP